MREREKGKLGARDIKHACVCLSPCVRLQFPKKPEEGPCRASNDRVSSLFCAIVFSLGGFYEKSLSMTQELPLCSVPPSTSIYFGAD